MLNTTHLRITDGTITRDLFLGDSMKVMQYQSGVSNSLDQSIDDQIQIAMVGSSAVNLANKDTLNLMLARARDYAGARTGPKVYIEGDLLNDGVYWRAQVLDGSIAWSDDMRSGLQTKFAYGIVYITRKPWDGPRLQLPISNLNAEADLAGLTVVNSSRQIAPISLMGWGDGSVIGWGDGSLMAWGVPSSGPENFFDIQGADIQGDLPAPIEIQITNNKSGSAKNKEFYLFHNIYSNPLTFNHMINADAFTGGTVTVADDADCQGGKKATLSWTGTDETLIATAPISSVLATNAAGGRFKILARWKGAFPYTDMFLRFRLLTSSGEEIRKSDLTFITSPRELSDLDPTRILPSAHNLSDMEDVKLALYGARNHSGTHTLVLNYLQLSPVSGNGGWKYFEATDDGIAYTETFIHDDIERHNYRINTAGKRSPNFTGVGGPILLVPGQDQRIYINQCDKDGAAKINQEWTVKLFYRPRRSSL